MYISHQLQQVGRTSRTCYRVLYALCMPQMLRNLFTGALAPYLLQAPLVFRRHAFLPTTTYRYWQLKSPINSSSFTIVYVCRKDLVRGQ